MKIKQPKQINLENKLWKIFSLYIRCRDAIKTTGSLRAIKCCTCQEIKPFADFDAGHYITIKNLTTKFNEKNVHAQCDTCNRLGRRGGAGEKKAYKYFLQKMYGEDFPQKLEYEAKKITQWMDFEKMIEIYEGKVKQLGDKQ